MIINKEIKKRKVLEKLSSKYLFIFFSHPSSDN